MSKIEYPVRINKYLAYKKICSRREADDFVRQGRVWINKKRAQLGDKVNFGDKVKVNQKAIPKKVYLAFNKPLGIVTHSPQNKEQGILDILNYQKKVFPIGRLDKNSWGLIILTNDGRITGKLLDPDKFHEKEYIVKVDKKIDILFVNQMEKGVLLDDGYRTKDCKVKKISNNTFRIVLTEGKNRQIRKMCSVLGFVVKDLRRVRIVNIKLGSLESGEYRKIKGAELQKFLDILGLD